MKTLLISLNAKYIHAALAPWYIKTACKEACGEIHILERTINDNMDTVLGEIYEQKPDVTAFSCYIWNITQVLQLAGNLKKLLPKVIIVLGGPEVWFGAKELMEQSPWIDYIVSGEGEESMPTLFTSIKEGKGLETGISGITQRRIDRIEASDGISLVKDLSLIPSPYTPEMLAALKDRILYYESSRGCPFSCAYCMSSTFEGVRFFPMERVKQELLLLIRHGVKQVKFVDRTFNCNKTRAKEIFRFLMEHRGNTHFHFEVAADLFDEETLELLVKAPAGLFQFEAGIQSTHPGALKAIQRETHLQRAFSAIASIKSSGNIHLHLDLIAGLPEEGLESFRESFNCVYDLGPHQLQLGFLKLLKGSVLRRDAIKYGYVFRDQPPCEVLGSRDIHFEELQELKWVEMQVERFYNSGRFQKSVEYLIDQTGLQPYTFYLILAEYLKEQKLHDRPISSRAGYTAMAGFIREKLSEGKELLALELLKYDFLAANGTGSLPEGLEREINPDFKAKCFEYLKNSEFVQKYLPSWSGIPAKQIYKHVHFEHFQFEVTAKPIQREGTEVLFDYSSTDPVTGLFRAVAIDMY